MSRRPSRRTQLLAVVRRETLQTARDKRMLAMLLGAPLLQLLVFGYAVDFKVDRVPTVIADQDQTAESREHARRLLADGTLREVEVGARRDGGRDGDGRRSSSSSDVAPAPVTPGAVATRESAGAEEHAPLDRLGVDGAGPAPFDNLGASAAGPIQFAEADAAIMKGEAAAAIIFPKGLSRDLARGENAQVQVIIDGTDPNRATVAGAAVAAYFAGVNADLLRARLAQQGALPASAGGGISLVPRIWFNPGLDSPPYMIPGVMAMLLVIVTTIVTSMGLAREREMGTLEQVLVTPIPPWVLLVGKMLPYVVIGFLDVGLALALGAFVFDLPIRGDGAVLVAATFAYLLSTLGVGLLISTVSKTQQQAFLGGFLFVMPAILLSGVMTPIRSMPYWLQAVTYLNPLRYYCEVLRANLLKGAGFAEVWTQLLALLVFGVGILLIATTKFRKRAA
ncbi:MAG: ABC transporter permease [Myxococcales bacterium]|jgi:ABC-2 type transport system permease protein